MTNDPHNFAPPPQPLGYASPYSAPPPSRRRGRGLVGWVLFVVFAVMLFMLLRNQGRTFTTIPYNEFNARLNPVGSPGTVPDRFEWMRIEGDTIYGKFVKSEDLPELAGPVTYFRVALPPGMVGQFAFFQNLVDRAGMARVQVEPENSLIINILLPLVPWLLIFSFVWFLIRSSRKHRSGTQLIISGPGRWIPDAPPPQAPPQ